MQNAFAQYIAELDRIYRAGNATEHSYRPALQRLLENMLVKMPHALPLQITNEPKRIACGAPDYIATRGAIPVGYIEAKDIGVDLDGKASREQLDRYRSSLNNLIITDYLTFQLFENGRQVMSVALGSLAPDSPSKKEGAGERLAVKSNPAQLGTFSELLSLFASYGGDRIKDSKHLSKLMATKARLVASIIENALDKKESSDSNSLDGQLRGFREALIQNITHKDFSDIYAQTIAYGMFAARLSDETADTFTRSKASQLIPQSNPFMQKFFRYIAGYELDERIRWVVDDLADMFNYVDAGAILQEFGKIEHDPVVHFYETFLSEYDPSLRKSRGVWYTPQPVVQFIVRAVDDILKQEFGLSKGLADSSKLPATPPTGGAAAEVKEYHRVQILDPATGTGTFLSGVVEHIYQQLKNQPALWSSYVGEHLIPRLNGFEILMASYAMAHLKLSMQLQKTGAPLNRGLPQRLRIYLTNSLEEAHGRTDIPFAQWLSDEANAASHLKQDVPVMVVLGNPPYSGESQNTGAWIEQLMLDYKKEPSGVKLQEKNSKWINDDYVKFIRYGQHLIEKNGEGVLAYINNHSFLDNPTFRGMRWRLLESFDKIYILDLHGNIKRKEAAPDGGKDENVFDIQQGVSINIFVKTGHKKSDKPAKVFRYDLYGKRAEKYNFLLNNSLQSVKWNELKLLKPQYFFVARNFSLQKEYEKGFSVQELFPVNSVGIVTARDSVFVCNSQRGLVAGIKNHFSITPDKKLIQLMSYRPFDNQYVYYDTKKIERSRGNVMQHFLKGENVGLMICRQQKTNKFYHCLMHKYIVESSFVSNKTSEIGYSFPLYLYPEPGKLFADNKRKPNLKKKIVKEIAHHINLSFAE
ncbi:MAG: N-6 DNA methylase, partial [Prevotellaceae bacterium]|nr:N-6 DNA methylase [Prevotellaceae bacterium]